MQPTAAEVRIRRALRSRRIERRERGSDGPHAYRFDGWELHLNPRRLTAPDGRVVPLTKGEFSLLVALLEVPRRALSRDELLGLSRVYSDEVRGRAVDVQILRLRRKIEPDPRHPRYIRTERGEGYVFGVPVEALSVC